MRAIDFEHWFLCDNAVVRLRSPTARLAISDRVPSISSSLDINSDEGRDQFIDLIYLQIILIIILFPLRRYTVKICH
jgi:hypothetical protein